MYTVRSGDCLASISHEFGQLSKTIWDHPSNSGLRKNRSDPHMLLPGDEIFIPPIDKRVEQAVTGQRHKYVLQSDCTMLRIIVKDLDEPVVQQPYELLIEGQSFKGITDGGGRLEERICSWARTGYLIVGQGDDALEYTFDLGTLDPLNSITGVQARLGNLGYHAGPIDGIHGPKTSAAVAEFCAEHGIEAPEDGSISQAFCDKLADEHGF